MIRPELFSRSYRLNVSVLLAGGITGVPQAEVEEDELRLYLGRPIHVCNPVLD